MDWKERTAIEQAKILDEMKVKLGDDYDADVEKMYKFMFGLSDDVRKGVEDTGVTAYVHFVDALPEVEEGEEKGEEGFRYKTDIDRANAHVTVTIGFVQLATLRATKEVSEVLYDGCVADIVNTIKGKFEE